MIFYKQPFFKTRENFFKPNYVQRPKLVVSFHKLYLKIASWTRKLENCSSNLFSFSE